MAGSARRACAVLILLLAGCTYTVWTDPDRSLPGADGKRVMHLNTTSHALHFALTSPFLGNARLERTHARLTEAARAAGATEVEVVHSEIKTFWYVVFPLTLLFTPVQTEVVANAVVPEKKPDEAEAKEQ